jgi:hypothetical protein
MGDAGEFIDHPDGEGRGLSKQVVCRADAGYSGADYQHVGAGLVCSW